MRHKCFTSRISHALYNHSRFVFPIPRAVAAVAAVAATVYPFTCCNYTMLQTRQHANDRVSRVTICDFRNLCARTRALAAQIIIEVSTAQRVSAARRSPRWGLINDLSACARLVYTMLLRPLSIARACALHLNVSIEERVRNNLVCASVQPCARDNRASASLLQFYTILLLQLLLRGARRLRTARVIVRQRNSH